MTIIETLKNYFDNLECLKIFGSSVNANFLGGEPRSYSLEEVPCNPIIKKYLDGSTLRQYQFVFCGREPYGAEILQNIENSTFYEDFANEIEEKNNNDVLPTLQGMEATSLEITSNAYTVSVTEDTAMYQINLNLKYYKK